MRNLIHQSALFLAVLFLASPLMAQQSKKGTGPTVEKNLQLDKFEAIKLNIAAQVTLHKGSQAVTVNGQQNIIDLIKTEVDGGVWKITFSENVSNYGKLTIDITIPELKGIKIHGSGDVNGKDAFSTSDDFYAQIHGSGNLDLNISAANIETDITGSGDMTLNGSAKKLDVAIKGSGDLDASNLSAADCSVKISGSGDCKVHASKNLDVDIMGSGDVSYHGDPAVKSKIMGSGKVQKG